MRHQVLTVALALLALLAGAGPTGAQPKPCDIDNLPAATLLLPFFAASLTNPPPINTFLAVINPTGATRIAHFTLWTDYAIPTASFDVVLTAGDVQTHDLYSLFQTGPPVTQEIPGCTGALSPGKIHLNPELGLAATLDEQLALLALAHTGGTLADGKVAGSLQSVAIGYLTIDVVNRCTALFPSNPGYFKKGGTGEASDANALVGDVFWVDNTRNIAATEPMVHIRAQPKAFRPGQYTFYGRYVGGRALDDRQPLSRTYGSRYFDGPIGNSVVATLLFIWRDTKSPATSLVVAGGKPAWAPLPVRSFWYWDEQENLQRGGIPPAELGLATQLFDVGASGAGIVYPFGWLRLDLGHRRTNLYGLNAQAWVTPVFIGANYPGPGSVVAGAIRAFPLEGLCKP